MSLSQEQVVATMRQTVQAYAGFATPAVAFVHPLHSAAAVEVATDLGLIVVVDSTVAPGSFSVMAAEDALNTFDRIMESHQ